METERINRMEKRPVILVVDDDPGLLRLVSRCLEPSYEVIAAEEGTAALRLVEDRKPSLMLLDIMMPGMDGFEVCRHVRKNTDTPVIMLTGRNGVEDVASALSIGADDYITKPFSHPELLARIKAVLRRTKFPEWMTKPSVSSGELHIDLEQHRVTVSGKEVRLCPTEYRVLFLLTRNAGRVLTQDQILQKVWGWEYAGYRHLLQVTVSRLRKKIGDDPRNPRYIVTHAGIGYRFASPVEITPCEA